MKIVVIEAFGLHLGYLGCYGNDWVGTPNLDRLAAEGIVFDWHYADQPELHAATSWLERSVATGRYAFPGSTPAATVLLPHVVRCASLASFASDAAQAIASSAPWVWLEGPSLLPPWNLEEELLTAYFDEDDEEEELVPWKDPPLETVTLTEPEFFELQNTYAAVVTYFDAQLGILLERLQAQQLLDDTLVCVTARSGLPLGEHGMIGTPQPALHDELVHVPLLIRLPKRAEAGLRIAALTQPVDLLPTFLEALQQPVAEGVHGQSLWPLIRSEVEAIRPYAVSALRQGERESRLLRSMDWAFQQQIGLGAEELRKPHLFAKPEDRWEVNDLYHQQTVLADAMEKALAAFAESIRQTGPLTYPVVDRSRPLV